MNKLSANVLNFYDSEIIPKIMNKYNCSFFDAAKKYFYSKTYKMLCDTSYGMTMFGPSAMCDIIYSEFATGDVKDSSYILGDMYG